MPAAMRVGGGHARDSAEKHAAPPVLLLKAARSDMRRHPARDFGHWGKQWQRALGAGHRLIGYGDDTGVHKIVGLLWISREMQVSEKNLTGTQLLAFRRQRLLDLHDQLRAPIYLGGRGNHLGADTFVVRIDKAGPHSGPLLQDHVVAVRRKLAHSRRHEPHPILAVLDFLRHA
jgi:hypothetical protein